MSALEPGLYRATVRGVRDVTVFIDSAGYGRSADYLNDHRTHRPENIIGARPLIVLDLGDDDPHHYIKALCQAEKRNHAYNLALRKIADQIAEQTRPARIPEPGLWGVVEATGTGNRIEWVHTVNGWSNGYHCHPWGYLIDPTLIREGVTE